MSNVNLKDMTLTATPGQEGTFGAFDAAGTNMGTMRTPTPLPSADPLTVTSIEFVENAVSGAGSHSSGFINDAFVSPSLTINYRNEINPSNAFGILDSCPSFTLPPSINYTNISMHSLTQTLLEVSAIDLVGLFPKDVVYIVGSSSIEQWLSGRVIHIDEVLVNGIVISVPFSSNTIPTGTFKKLSSTAFNTPTAINASVDLAVIGGDDLADGYLGTSGTYNSVVGPGPNVYEADFVNTGGFQQDLSNFIRLTSVGGSYDGIFPFVLNPDGISVRIEVPFTGTDSGTYEYVLFTPTITVTSEDAFAGLLDWALEFESVLDVGTVTAQIALFKRPSGSLTFSLIPASVKRLFLYTSSFMGNRNLYNTILDFMNTNDQYILCVTCDTPTPSSVQFQNYSLLMKS